jgi:hypothetical protein
MLHGLETKAAAIEQLLAGGVSLSKLSNESLRTLLAFKFWADGSDDESFISSVWKTDPSWTRDRVIETLTTIFDYKQ